MEIVPYHVSYSGRVHESLRELIIRADALGLGRKVFDAAREIERILRIYPQFGQPLRDLAVGSAQLWIGVVPPLVVHYILDEEHRQVMVVRPMQPLSRRSL